MGGYFKEELENVIVKKEMRLWKRKGNET